MRRQMAVVLGCVLAIYIVLSGCEIKSDEEKTVQNLVDKSKKMAEDVQKDVKDAKVDMSKEVKKVSEKELAKLRAEVSKYKDQIASKEAELKKLSAQLKEIPVTEMLGDKAKKLKGDIDSLNKVIKQLKEQYDLFNNKLKEQGGGL